MKKQNKFERKEKIIIAVVFLILIAITLTTQYIGSTDTSSFTSPSKYFAGKYQAKIRSSHSYLWGFLNSPYVAFTESFISFKIFNLFILSLIIFSVYYMSGKNKKIFYLALFSPLIWYMAPWINSIQISSLFFLWCYFFIKRHSSSKKLKNIFYSGIFFGLAAAFWHAIFFFGLFFIIFYFYDKKAFELSLFLIAILIGLIPNFILDFFLYNYPFHSLLKNTLGTFSNLFGLGVYSHFGSFELSILNRILIILLIPFYFWKSYYKDFFKKNYRIILFITTSLIIIMINSQIRYLLLIFPFIILLLLEHLDKNKFKKQIIIFILLSAIITIPYLLQIFYSTPSAELSSFIGNLPSLQLDKISQEQIFQQDLNQIAKNFPNQIFLVGNFPDDYQTLANIYWGEGISEFVSVQDYQLFLQNSSVLIEREIRFSPININDRREFWISGGIGKPLADNTDYSSIKYAISEEKEFCLEEFKIIKSYESLNLFEKKND